MYFKLRNVDYEMTSYSELLTNKDTGIHMSIRVVAKTEEVI